MPTKDSQYNGTIPNPAPLPNSFHHIFPSSAFSLG